MKAMKVSATLDSVRTLKDRSFKLVFETLELGADDGAVLLSMRQQAGWLLFAPLDVDVESHIPPEPPREFKADKTPSQRMRACLFRLWEQNKRDMTFNEFYDHQMEKYIAAIKERLEEGP